MQKSCVESLFRACHKQAHCSLKVLAPVGLIAAGIIYYSVQYVPSAHAQVPSMRSQPSIPVARGSVSLIGVSGNTILDSCMKPSYRDQDYCLAWVQLAADNAMQLKTIDPKLPLCIPQQVDATQLRDVAIDYLRKNPKDRHLAATILVADAFYQAWPCAGEQGRW